MREAIALCEDGKCDMLILDEAMGALSTGMLDEKLLMNFLKNRPEHIEVVMTGRNPGAQLIELADYVSDLSLIHILDGSGYQNPAAFYRASYRRNKRGCNLPPTQTDDNQAPAAHA